jgi:hypothetical protein
MLYMMKGSSRTAIPSSEGAMSCTNVSRPLRMPQIVWLTSFPPNGFSVVSIFSSSVRYSKISSSVKDKSFGPLTTLIHAEIRQIFTSIHQIHIQGGEAAPESRLGVEVLQPQREFVRLASVADARRVGSFALQHQVAVVPEKGVV